jgi:4-hydroxybenzoate polyprenyltransferase
VSFATRLKAHVAIARVDHWVKNVFVIPGAIIPFSIEQPTIDAALLTRIAIGIASVSLIASSNYVINEVLDAPLDRLHPIKKHRPVPSGLVNIPLAYVEWIVLMVIGMLLAFQVSRLFTYSMAALWIMGCIYNMRPIRTKDVVYLDVLTESVNNPLRLLAGWYMVSSTLVAPLSLVLSYWMVGCYFMALKRFSEYREINSKEIAAAYRRSFQYYTEQSLLVSVTFYASTAMLFFGAFIIRYRLELIFSFPFVAWVMAVYFNLAFEPNSAVQNPEYLYKKMSLLISVSLCAIAIAVLLFIDMPTWVDAFAPSLPIRR